MFLNRLNKIITFFMMISLINTTAYGMTWEKVSVKKGFWLSKELVKNECKMIWSERIPEFLEKNPNVKDPNKFEIGDVIYLQDCRKNEPNYIVVKDITKQEMEKQVSEVEADDAVGVKHSRNMVSFLVGSMILNNDSQDTAYGLEARGTLVKGVDYQLSGFLSGEALIYNHGVMIYKEFDSFRPYFVISSGSNFDIGGERSDYESFFSYLRAGLGISIIRGSLYYDMALTTNFTESVDSQANYNFDLSVMKAFRDFHLGMFLKIGNAQEILQPQTVDGDEERATEYAITGLKVGF